MVIGDVCEQVCQNGEFVGEQCFQYVLFGFFYVRCELGWLVVDLLLGFVEWFEFFGIDQYLCDDVYLFVVGGVLYVGEVWQFFVFVQDFFDDGVEWFVVVLCIVYQLV